MASPTDTTPLNVIAGYVDLLADGVRGHLSAPQLKDLERIRSNEQALLQLVEAVLEYARIEAGIVVFQTRTIPVAAVLLEVTAEVEETADRRSVRVEHFRSGGEAGALTVLGDPARLKQVLTNLLCNAVNRSPEGGTVLVTQASTGGALEIRFSDEGPDAVTELEDACEPLDHDWEVAENSALRTGLRLAISRGLAAAMGGSLVVRNTAGEGSTVILSLPIGPPTAVARHVH